MDMPGTRLPIVFEAVLEMVSTKGATPPLLVKPAPLPVTMPAIAALLEWLYARFLRIRPRLQALLR